MQPRSPEGRKNGIPIADRSARSRFYFHCSCCGNLIRSIERDVDRSDHMSTIQKGSTLFSQEPWAIIPLTLETNCIHCSEAFPRFSADSSSSRFLSNELPSLSAKAAKQARKLLQSQTGLSNDTKYEIIVCLHLVLEGRHCDACRCCVKEEKNDNNDEDDESVSSDHPIAKKIWNFISEKIEFNHWISLLSYVRKRLLVIMTEHPLIQYATTVIPTFNEDELNQLHHHLFPGGLSKNVSLLAMMKHIQDNVEPEVYGVLLDDPSANPDDSINSFRHSCLPNGYFDLVRSSGKTRTTITALYDIDNKEEISVCLIEDNGSMEQREIVVNRRFERSCACVRCRYEATESVACLDVKDAIRIGHYYLAKGRLEDARALYLRALSVDKENLDVWHALGAIELSLGKFLEAQRVWKKAAIQFPASYETQRGIALQVEKLKCYNYLTDPGQGSHSEVNRKLTWSSIVPQAHVTSGLLNVQTCSQILKWAEMGTWTQQRHYAVPTHDIPVHTVPPLLEWLKRFMTETMRHLLAMQFHSSPNYYVHDAFCVRYEAGQVSNHLPIHTDESTHSFVLALNEEYHGGGTHFYDYNKTVHLKTGDVLSFRGEDLFHGGEAVTQGKRYIMAVFLYHDDDDDGQSSSDFAIQRTSKRPSSEMTESFSTTKEQKISDFSFGFDLDG